MYTPLEQFNPHILIPLMIQAFDFSLTLGTFFFIGIFIFELILLGNHLAPTVIPTPGQYFNELASMFFFGILYQQTGPRGIPYLPFFYTCFIVVFFSQSSWISSVRFYTHKSI